MATLISLPANGLLLHGSIRNLSQGGCYVEGGLALPSGTQAEIIARIHTGSFRALAEIRAVHAHSGMCLRFVKLSAGAEHMLEELIARLARLRKFTNPSATKVQTGIVASREVRLNPDHYPVLRALATAQEADPVLVPKEAEPSPAAPQVVSESIDFIV